MIKRCIQIGILISLFSVASLCLAQDRMAVKLSKQVEANNWIGNRLIVYLDKGIAASSVLKPAGEDNVMLICDLLIVKIENRPSCAYSMVVTGNAYGKVTPVLLHRLGVFGKNAVKQAAQRILEELENQARSFQQEARKAQE